MQVARAPAAELRCILCGESDLRPSFRKHRWIFGRCAGCGLVSVRPLPTAEEARRAGFCAEGLDASAVSVAQARAQGLVVHHSAVEDFVRLSSRRGGER